MVMLITPRDSVIKLRYRDGIGITAFFGMAMLGLAQFCLTSQIVLAPLLLGGARPWAMAILTLLTGVGLVAITVKIRTNSTIKLPPAIKQIALAGLLISIWMALQAAPIWPIQPAPFEARQIALYPTAFCGVIGNLIWLIGTYILAALIAQNRGPAFPRLIIVAVIISGCFQILLAGIADILALETTFWFAKQSHLGDWTGSFANRNAFGGLMGVSVLGCLYVFCAKPAASPGQRIDTSGGWLALALIFTAALTQSHSRSALVALAIAVPGFAMLYRPDRLRIGHWRWGYPVILILAALATLIIITMANPEIARRFAQLARPDLIQRDDAWATAIIAISHRPFAGFGPGSIAVVLDHFATNNLNRNAQWFSSHNLWLDIAITLGIPATLSLIGFGLYRWIKALRASQSGLDRALLVTLGVQFAIMATFGWVAGLPALVLPLLCLLAGLEAAPPLQPDAGHQYRAAPRQSGPQDQDHAI
ncbi:O-antigen ligase family protein [Thalassospira alkalitolerans]|uniref:O-antigen ligase family protein n=1 Tax=Thalassospira alkalitolerans TaxID=1293890 RepID=UPI0030EDCEE9|tara:strand:+ start:33909 stop:35342 length:1434 start_codon:yes stop_codon:yes gene_type:complete